jgi:hypothetical protein
MRVEERESLGLVRGQSLRTMATGMGRAFSMVSREHARNAAKGQPFRAGTAHHLEAARADATTNPDVLFFLQFSQKPSTVRLPAIRLVARLAFLW